MNTTTTTKMSDYMPSAAAEHFWAQAKANHEARGPHSFPMDMRIGLEAVDLALASAAKPGATDAPVQS